MLSKNNLLINICANLMAIMERFGETNMQRIIPTRKGLIYLIYSSSIICIIIYIIYLFIL